MILKILLEMGLLLEDFEEEVALLDKIDGFEELDL